MSRTLFVDLDHSLLKTNLLFELIYALLKDNPSNFFKGVYKLLSEGRNSFQEFVIENSDLKTDRLPLNSTLLEFLKSHRQKGAKLILVSSFNTKIVRKIADELRIFDEIVTNNGIDVKSSGVDNNPILQLLEKENDFDYLGPKKSESGMFQNAKKNYYLFKGKVRNYKNPDDIIFSLGDHTHRSKFYFIAKQLRIHQWAKNILVFLPLILAHEWLNFDKWFLGLCAFFSFSFVASSVYIVNDLWDLNSDRLHSYKKNRPIASGNLNLTTGLILIPLIFLLGLFLGWFYVSIEFALVLLLYWFLTSSYTFFLKRKMLLDVLILAGVYTIRLYGGAVATDLIITEWLLGFSLFFFLSLALVKRYTELNSEAENKGNINLSRGYISDDLPLLMSVGVSSGMMSILIFALYISSPSVIELYSNHKYLWFAVPVLLYWIIRIWKLVKRGLMHEDPVLFAIKDKISITCGLAIFVIIIISTY